MSLIELKVPDIGDFKDVEVIELLVKPGEVVVMDNLPAHKPPRVRRADGVLPPDATWAAHVGEGNARIVAISSASSGCS
mgnify:CR=1 FL=1